MSRSQLQGNNRKDAAARPHIQKSGFGGYIFFQLTDAQLRRLMHAGAEGRSGVNVKNHLVPVLILHLLPGRNDQNIINVELFKVLFPVIDPVRVLGLGNFQRSRADVAELAQFIQCPADLPHDSVHIILLRIQIEIQPGDPVICLRNRGDVHEHLCLFRFGERGFILNLRPLYAAVIQRRYHDILRALQCFQTELFPLHGQSSSNFSFIFSRKDFFFFPSFSLPFSA